MRNYQITAQPVVIEANSLEEAQAKALASLTVEVEEVESVDSILEDMLGKDGADLFRKA